MKKYQNTITIEYKMQDLYSSLMATRDEPVLSLNDIAGIINDVFDDAEVESLIRSLKAEKEEEYLSEGK